MRIITGIYRGRRFDIPRNFKARPTTDFAKENLFNVLMGVIDLEGRDALDLFSGTGSISLELLSRGCRTVTSVELDRDHARFIDQCVSKIGAKADHRLVRGDVFRFLKGCCERYDLIFADPPYALPTLSELPEAILSRHLLRPEGVLVVEHGDKHHFENHPLFWDHRSYGSVNFSLFRPAVEAAAER